MTGTPRKGEFISARVVAARADRDDPVAVIAGQRWALARPGDPVIPAPAVPREQRPGQTQPGHALPQVLADWPDAIDPRQ